jgi:TonB family protein
MLEATQTGRSPILFKAGRQWEGRVVGNYRLRQYLGSTEHSAVFLTEVGGDESRKAAIKLIAAEGSSSSLQLDRWRLAMKVSHPHILQIFDVGACQISGDDLLFVVTEYAEENLSQILPERALTEAEMREMLQPTLDALAYLHQNGFSHGRMKPSNVLVAREQLKLSSDSIGGTGGPNASSIASAYEAPEVAQTGISPAGDLWSLATLVVEALTQHLPEWKNRLIEEPSVPEGIHQPFADIARRCLLRDPRTRWTVADIRARLQPQSLPDLREKLRPRLASIEGKSLNWLKSLEGLSLKSLNWLKSIKPLNWLNSLKPLNFASKWVYAIPVLALLATILLLSSLLHRKSSAPAKVAEAPVSTATTSPAQQQKPVAGHKGRSAVQSESNSDVASFAPGRVAHQVVPEVPQRALATIRGTVRVTVKVHVNSAGDVAKADVVSGGPSRYFANLAMDAAREWKFTPGNEQRALFIRFDFERSGVTAHPHG